MTNFFFSKTAEEEKNQQAKGKQNLYTDSGTKLKAKFTTHYTLHTTLPHYSDNHQVLIPQ